MVKESKRRRYEEDDDEEPTPKASKKHLPATPGAVNLFDLVEKFTPEDMAEQAKDDAQSAGAGGSKRYFKLSGDDTLRLCPKRKGARILYRELWRHGIKDAGEGKWKPVVCVAKMSPPGRCYVCEVLSVLERETSKSDTDGLKEISEQKPRCGAYWNIIDMKTPEAGAQESWLPISIHKEIKVQTGLDERKEELDCEPWDIEEGFPIRIKRSPDNKYSVKFLHKKTEQLDPESYLGMVDLEKSLVPLAPADLFKIAKYMAENYDCLDLMDWDDVPYMKGGAAKAKKRRDDDDEDEPPKKAKRRVDDDEDEPPKKAKKRSSVSDDDFEEVASLDDEDDDGRKRKVVIEVPKKKAKKRVEEDDAWE